MVPQICCTIIVTSNVHAYPKITKAKKANISAKEWQKKNAARSHFMLLIFLHRLFFSKNNPARH
jgi:hypothetical protein